MLDACPAACEALRGLTNLQQAAPAYWAPEFLPALTACVQLTCISGQWKEAGSVFAGVPLPQVYELFTAGGTAPFRFFGNLQTLRASITVDTCAIAALVVEPAAYLPSLCRHCTALRELQLDADRVGIPAGADQPAAVDSRARVVAVQTLSALQHLTLLVFTPRDNTEQLALVKACCVLEQHSLREPHLSQGLDTSVTPAGWMQLGKLAQLRQLSLRLRDPVVIQPLAEEAFVFLSALSGCEFVSLRLPGGYGEVADKFHEALAALSEAGLPAPQLDFPW
jgi:hypothetical protein